MAANITHDIYYSAEVQKAYIQKFNTLYAKIKARAGVKTLVKYLKNETDFFEAPASANERYHGRCKMGLLIHSCNTAEIACQLLYDIVGTECSTDLTNSILLAALFHDVCKTNFYFEKLKWRKDENDQWEPYMSYEIKDTLPLGHGEKSVHIIRKFVDLSDMEIAMIQYHMGHFQVTGVYYEINWENACIKWPTVPLLHAADLLAANTRDVAVETRTDDLYAAAKNLVLGGETT